MTCSCRGDVPDERSEQFHVSLQRRRWKGFAVTFFGTAMELNMSAVGFMNNEEPQPGNARCVVRDILPLVQGQICGSAQANGLY